MKKGIHHSHVLQAASEKYGIDNLKIEILEICENSCLTEREQFYMDVMRPKYNSTLFAHSPLSDPDVKKRASENRKAAILKNGTVFNAFKNGYVVSDETREKLRNVVFSEARRLKLSDAKKKAFSISGLGNAAIPILCVTTGKTYKSQTQAAQALNVSVTAINNNLRGVSKSACGLTFKYHEELKNVA